LYDVWNLGKHVFLKLSKLKKHEVPKKKPMEFVGYDFDKAKIIWVAKLDQTSMIC
jgi:hypothetical protein